MKLYTEEQVREVLSNMLLTTKQVESIFEELNPIEIPSDEEIIYRCFQEDSYELGTDGDSALKVYSDGYKAALEQILNQNK
jgi:hypothetical protein